MWIIRSIIFLNMLLMLFSTIFGGLVITLYGNMCGLDVFSYNSWVKVFLFSISPWCKFLNWCCWLSMTINDHIIYHGISSAFGIVFESFPYLKNVVHRPNGITHSYY